MESTALEAGLGVNQHICPVSVSGECREKLAAGWYADVQERLVHLLDQQGPCIAVSVELADCLVSQGHLAKARHHLDAALVGTGSHNCGRALKAVARILQLFAESHSTCRFADAINECNSLWTHVCSTVADDDYFKALAILYRFRLLSQAKATRKSCYQNVSDECERELLGLSRFMLQNKQYNMSFRFASLLDDLASKSQVFQSLISQDIPEMVRAKIIISTAEDEAMNDPPDAQVSACLYVLEQQHAFRHLAFKANRELSKCLKREAFDVPIIQLAAEHFEHLDYLLGLYSLQLQFRKALLAVFDYNTAAVLEQEMEANATKMGLESLHHMELATTLARSQLRLGFEDRTRSAAIDLYNSIESTELAYSQGHLASIISQIFMLFGDHGEAQAWQNCCREHWRQCQPEDEAHADIIGFNLESQLISIQQSDTEAGCQSFVNRIRSAVDTVAGLQNPAQYQIQYLSTATTLVAKSRNTSMAFKVMTLQQLHEQMSTIIDASDLADKDSQIASLTISLANCYALQAPARQDLVMEHNSLMLFHEALRIYRQTSNAQPTFHLISTRQQIGLMQIAMFKKACALSQPDASQHLDAAYESFTQCAQGWLAFGSPSLLAQCRYWLARVKNEQFMTYGDEFFEPLFSSLELAEHDYDQQRMELSISSGLGSIRDKQALAKDNHARDIYRFAIQACIKHQNLTKLWIWVQKSKARSLSDHLGLGASIPKSLVDEIQHNQHAKELLQREADVMQETKCQDIGQRFHAHQKLLQIQPEMRRFPLLQRLIHIRTGFAHTLEEIRILLGDQDSGLPSGPFSMIDWVLSSGQIWLLVVSAPDFDVKLRCISCSSDYVPKWKEQYLKTDEGIEQALKVRIFDDDDDDQPLRQLDALIEPVTEFTKPGELLVLCPSGSLDSIPMHALHVSAHSQGYQRYRRTLLDRNPIVYTSSMTTFVQSCREAHRVEPEIQSSFTSVYEAQPGTELDVHEQGAAYKQIERFAELYSGRAAVGLEVESSDLEGSWPSSRLILFHGHCEREGDDIRRQALILGRSSFSVPSFFKLRLLQPLVILIACGSSSQQISPGDEPLGILTALLCAGAATVLGTLWDVRSEPARHVADTFLELLLKELDSTSTDGSDFIDLARLFRRAIILARNTGSNELIDWGAFVLHGSWYMKRGPMAPWPKLDQVRGQCFAQTVT